MLLTYYRLLKGGFGVTHCNNTQPIAYLGGIIEKKQIQAMFSSEEVTRQFGTLPGALTAQNPSLEYIGSLHFVWDQY